MELSWVRSCRRFGSGSWLHAIPSIDVFKLRSHEFRAMLAIRLMAPVPEARSMLRCICGYPVRFDLHHGVHYFGQCGLASQSTWKHNGVVRVLRQHGSPRVSTQYRPFILEASGAFGKAAEEMFKSWVERAGDIGVGSNYRRDQEDHFETAWKDLEPGELHDFTFSAINFASFWLQRLSFEVCRSQARAVLDGVRRSASVVPAVGAGPRALATSDIR